MTRLLVQFLYLLLLTAPLYAQDSTDVDPTDGEEVIISPEDDQASADSTDADYQRERAERNALRDTVSYPAANDRTPVRVRSVDAALLEDIRSSRDYQYGDSVPPTASLWDRFWAWFWQLVGDLLRTKAYRNVGQYVLLLGIAAGAIWLLYKADVLTRLFPGRARNLPLGYDVLDENIHAINFTDRINEAVEQRNYRLAVRLLYLQTLKRLTDNGLIQWQPNKTNRQYTYELTGNPARLGFERLTTQFEYVWYGDFPVDEARFGLIQQEFNAFNT